MASGGPTLHAAMDVVYACDRIRGARPYQEDDFDVVLWNAPDADGCDILLVLADGMGGHRGGAKASELAVAAVGETFPAADGGIAARLRASVDAANDRVGEWASGDARYRGMGCTLVACVVTDDADLHWISVGDSPLWLIGRAPDEARRSIRRLNEDHSMRPVLEHMARLGQITPEEAGRGGHQLRSAVMGDPLTLVDEEAEPVRLEVGDRIILASDGVETLSIEQIRSLGSANRSPSQVVGDLLGAVEARDHPSQDNATALVYFHTGPAAVRRRLAYLTGPTKRL